MVEPAGLREPDEVTAPASVPYGYGPADLAAAYGLDPNRGTGQTVALVDAYDSPTAESDLAAYRTQYGLPACTTANGCFRKVNQAGASSPVPAATSGWAAEIALDVDMVSAACPQCNILLVKANSSYTSDSAQRSTPRWPWARSSSRTATAATPAARPITSTIRAWC